MDPAEISQAALLITADHQYSNDHDSRPKKVCPICNKELPPNANLSFHMMLHPSEKPFACDHCLHIFKTKEDLKQHCLDIHTSEHTHRCEVCGKVFRFSANLKRHRDMRHSDIARYECIYCDTPFKEYGQYRTHEAAHDRVTNFHCIKCGVYFGSKKDLDSHVESDKCGKKILKCCTIEFNNRMEYVQHTIDQHKKYKQVAQKCQYCEKTFPFVYLKNVHELQCSVRPDRERPEKRIETDADGNAIPFPCEHCDRIFQSYRGLLLHAKVHKPATKDSRFTCTICNKQLASYTSLYVHRARHLNIKRYFCEFCNKGYFTRNMMIAHRVVHTKEKPFKCRYCEKAFPYKTSMFAHERSHTGERPFSCRFCEMKFMRFSAKQNHERRHTGEKPYTCTICKKSFLQHSTWKQHERTHSDRIQCEHCGNEFGTKKLFKLHRRGGQCHVNGEEYVANHDKITTEHCNLDNMQQTMETIEEVIPGNVAWDQPSHMTTDANGNVYVYYQMP